MPALGLKMRIDRLTSLIASVYQTGLQMWHKFTATTWDGSTDRLPDSSPVGTNTAALYTGRGLSFDGVNDVVTVGATGVTVKTVVFYAYPDTTTTAFMQLQSTGAVRVEISSGTLSATGFTSPTLYVNGAASSTVAATTWQQIAVTSATGVSASNVLLGQSNTTYYGGDLSNVKFFSVELTAGQIAELYANPEQALPTGVSAGDLVGWWPLADGTTLGFVVDGSSNKNHAVISGASESFALPSPATQFALKGNSYPMAFDGVDDYVNITTLPDTDLAFSVTTSIFFTGTGSLNHTICTLGGGGFGLFYLIGHAVSVSIVTNDYGFIGLSGDAGLNPDVVNYITVTHDGAGDFNLYINNVLQSGTAGSGISNLTTGVIGRRSVAGGQYFDGVVNYLCTFDSTLGTDEIAQIYAGGISFDFNQNDGDYTSSGNILGYWKNTGNTNADWIDRSGNGNNGTVFGSPGTIYLPEGTTLNRDILGTVLHRPNNGEIICYGNSYALATDAATLDITTDITLEAWVKPFTVASLQSAIGKNSAYALNITAGAKLQFQRWSSTASGTVSSSASLTADTWYHIAATYDGTTTKLYINGTEDTSSGAVTGAIDSTATDVLLGALTTSTNLFSGYLDSVKVYDEILTAAQIKQNYNAEKGSHQNS